MALSGHLSKLQAVNEILASIGEDPVNTLTSGLPDAESAERFLDNENRQIQIKGWHENRLYNYVLTLNASNQFPLPDNTISARTVNPRGTRLQTATTSSGFIAASMRRSGDDTKWLMWDDNNNSETWTDVNTLAVEIVQLLEFANLTPALQIYVWTSAAHRFQKSVMGSAVLHEFTREDVDLALVDAVNEDAENQSYNVISGNRTASCIAHRNNYLSGW